MSASALSAGNVTINADTERLLMGQASAPGTGTGIFMGLDGSDYEFRVGDDPGAADAQYIHWDGTDLKVGGEIVATSFTGTDPEFTGGKIQLTQDVSVEQFTIGVSGETWHNVKFILTGGQGAVTPLTVKSQRGYQDYDSVVIITDDATINSEPAASVTVQSTSPGTTSGYRPGTMIGVY